MATKKLTPADYIDEARRLAETKGDNEAALLRWLANRVERAEELARAVDEALSTTRALGGPAAVRAALCNFRLKAGKEA